MQKPKCTAIVLAGGSGKRMGTKVQKQYLEIDGKPVLVYSLQEFEADYNSKGKAISGSRKNKVINYVNSLDLSIPQKAILIKSTNTFKFNDYNNQIIESKEVVFYINSVTDICKIIKKSLNYYKMVTIIIIYLVNFLKPLR